MITRLKSRPPLTDRPFLVRRIDDFPGGPWVVLERLVDTLWLAVSWYADWRDAYEVADFAARTRARRAYSEEVAR